MNSLLGARRGGSDLLGQAIKSFQNNLARLARLNTKEAERLALLMELLVRLDPDHADRYASQMGEFANRMADLEGGVGQALVSPADLQLAQASPAQGQTLHISMEVRIDARVDEVVAKLQENGVSVQQTSMELSQTIRLDITIGPQGQQKSDPLTLDLDGNGIELSSAANGEQFDINGDGKDEQSAFVRGGDAFLAIDSNGNGQIDSGRELFGDQDGAVNGFAKLSEYDSNQDGRIDESDDAFGQLRLMKDINGDGRVARDEAISLKQAGVKALMLAYASGIAEDAHGNLATEASSFERADGSRGLLVDVKVGHL
ncbi:MAG: hypothetical protein NTW86_09070 [Candidatus Sumerlaeota bacterium]|nr:hypothetical protein [Candidatus Sumerlaeota bacterium]